MNGTPSDDIRRTSDGVIDYKHYASQGRLIRSREIGSLAGAAWPKSLRPIRILPVVALLCVLNVLGWW